MSQLPPRHQLILTEDGSQTLYSETYQEACHSTHGAVAETRLHYIEGCQLKRWLSQQTQINILEIGFGAGIGFLETWKFWQEEANGQALHFVSTEIDLDLIPWVIGQHSQHPLLSSLALKQNASLQYWQGSHQQHTLTILQGDACSTLQLWQNLSSDRFHAIYQDAFSPKRNPELWTRSWFELLASLCAPHATLSTYSASMGVRKSMMEAGWGIRLGEKFGPKRSSTRATLGAESDPQFVPTR